MRLKLISCEIFYREMCAAVARSPHQVEIEFLPKGLHDIGAPGMLQRVQQGVDGAGRGWDAVLIGYALCGNGIVGLTARGVPLVVPRGHDCITLFLGSRERYLEYFNSHPGVYFKTTGWIERGAALNQLSIQGKTGIGWSYGELAAKYGEENARYLLDQLGGYANYRQLTFIRMGIEPDGSFEATARGEADRRGWKFEAVDGDMSLIHRLVNGQWGEKDFLIVPPGWRVVATYDDRVIAAEEVK